MNNKRVSATNSWHAAAVSLYLVAGTATAADTPASQESAGNATLQQQIDSLKEQVQQLSLSTAQRNVDTGLPIHGFIDVGAAFRTNEDLPRGAGLGVMDLYLTPQISPRIKSLVEFNVELDRGSEPQGETVDLERMQIGSVFNDNATLWLGRFHTPYGYWNTAFHHGGWLPVSVQRPVFLEFEDSGGILPAHNNGAWLTGNLGNDRQGRLLYDMFLANGPRVIDGSLDPNLATDSNHSGFGGVRLGYQPAGALAGVTLGLHWLHGQVDTDDANGFVLSNTLMDVLGGYVVYQGDAAEWLNEYYHFDDRNEAPASTHRSWAGYSQLSYNIKLFTPYIRGEKTQLDQTDTYFASLSNTIGPAGHTLPVIGESYSRQAAGLRYDLDAKACIKFEANHTLAQLPTGHSSFHEYRFMYAIRF